MEHLTDLTCAAFTQALGDKVSVPGGGGASALAGALGAALGAMVGNFTVGKPKYAAVEADLQALLAQSEALRQELLACVDRDAEAFEPLSRAYGIPKDDPTRSETLERCLRQAAQAPMEILRLCCQAVRLHEAYAEKGSAIMLSDVGTGAALCRGAMLGAVLNVKVNTRLMADREYARALNDEADALLSEYAARADAVWDQVHGRVC